MNRLGAFVFVAFAVAPGCHRARSSVDAGPPSVRVHLPLHEGSLGSAEERAAIFELSDRVHAAVEPTHAGDLDGNEFGAGECTMILHASDPARVWLAIEPVLRASPLAHGGHADLHGANGDRRVDL